MLICTQLFFIESSLWIHIRYIKFILWYGRKQEGTKEHIGIAATSKHYAWHFYCIYLLNQLFPSILFSHSPICSFFFTLSYIIRSFMISRSSSLFVIAIEFQSITSLNNSSYPSDLFFYFYYFFFFSSESQFVFHYFIYILLA